MEMSCGFATLDLDLSAPLLKETRLVLGLMGGNLSQAVAIKDSEVLARRSGFRALAAMFSGPVKSQLSLKLSPAGMVAASGTGAGIGGLAGLGGDSDARERFVNYLRYVPCELIVTWSTLEVLKLFLELLASFVLLPALQPLQVAKSSQVAISLFLRGGPSGGSGAGGAGAGGGGGIVDTPDLLQVLAELWADARKGLRKQALREHDQGAISHAAHLHLHDRRFASDAGGAGGGGAGGGMDENSSAAVLWRFRRCLLRLVPALSLAPGVLPGLVVGITDLRRLALLRAIVHGADPLAMLTADGMLQGSRSGGGAAAAAAAGAPPAGTTRAPMSLARANSVQAVRADLAAASSAAAQALLLQQAPFGMGMGGGRRASSSALSLSLSAGFDRERDGLLRDDGTGAIDPFVGNAELKHIYAPFHTNEIAYDPNGHSGQSNSCEHEYTSHCRSRERTQLALNDASADLSCFSCSLSPLRV